MTIYIYITLILDNINKAKVPLMKIEPEITKQTH